MKILAFQLREELQPYFPLEKRGNIWLPDLWFYSPKLKEVEQFLQTSWVDKLNYIKDTWDCDDFALALLADCRRYTRWLVEFCHVDRKEACPWTLVEVWDKQHSFNAVRTRDKGIKFIEPQSDKIFDYTEGNLIYARG